MEAQQRRNREMSRNYKVVNIARGLEDSRYVVVKEGEDLEKHNAQAMADKLNNHDRLIAENEALLHCMRTLMINQAAGWGANMEDAKAHAENSINELLASVNNN
jgi:hypothetical protein